MMKIADGIKRAVGRDGDVSRGVEVAEALHAFIFSNHEMARKAETLLFLLRLKERPELVNPSRGLRHPQQASPMAEAPRPLFETNKLAIPKDAPLSKAEIWKQFMESRTESSIRIGAVHPLIFDVVKIERLLLRDLVGVLRGLNGEYLKFDEALQAYVLVPDARISPLLSSLALELAKIGVAFRQTQRMLAFFRPECGLIAQGFRAGAEAELLEFHRMVALFESLVIESTDPARGMNLRRATAWFTVPARKLGFLRKVVEACQDVSGAPLLERVSRYRDHGNDNFRAIAQNLLAQMTRPYLRCLAEWIAKGDLVDPHGELFIVQAKALDASVSGQDAWHKLYHVAQERIPTGLFDEATIRRILLVGKTLNFAKVCDQHCEGKAGGSVEMEVEAMGGAADANGSNGEIEADTPVTLDVLMKRLDAVQASACSGLSRRLFAEFRLRDHLALLKDALLLGRADFAQALLDSLAECLSKPASAIFRHNLVGVLETCLQGAFASNGQSDPLLGNVDVRLHEPSRDASGSHQFGWDIFSLDYRVPAPLDAVLGGDAMREYARLSQYLWMEKRLEYTLNQSTRRLHGLHRISRLSAGRYARSIGEDVFADYRRLQMLHQEALGFVAALASHSMDVVAGSWAWLESQLSDLAGSDLDRIIAVHAAYMARIKASLVTCFNPAIRSRLIGVFSACLKIDQVCQAFEAHLGRAQELAAQQARLRQLQDSGDAASLQQATAQFSEWTGTQHRMLVEFRAQFQSAVRQFHADVDGLMEQVQREALALPLDAKDSLDGLSLRLDYSGYHARRNGFDAPKYACPIKGTPN